MNAIFKRELRSTFCNTHGYLILALFLAVAGYMFRYVNLENSSAQFEYTIMNLSIILLVVVPLLTMRVFAGERKAKTDTLLYSLPLPLYRVVLGKYLASFTVFLIPCGVMALFPLIMKQYGTVSFANAYGSLLAFVLLGASMIAIGVFFSSVCSDPDLAAVLTFGVLLLTYLMESISTKISSSALVNALLFVGVAVIISLIVYAMTKNYLASYIAFAAMAVLIVALYLIKSELFEGAFASLLSFVSLYSRLNPFANNVFDLSSVIYYLSVTVLFLFFSVQSVEKRRWS